MKLVACYLLVASVVIGGHRNGVQAQSSRIQNSLDQLVRLQETNKNVLLTEIQEIKAKMQSMEAEIKKLSDLSQPASNQLKCSSSTPEAVVPETISSCKTAPKSGLYQLKLTDMLRPITVLCEMDTFGGGWTVVQQRLDKLLNFDQHFIAYRDGFGTVGQSTEFWLGLEAVHQLTKNGTTELSVEMRGYQNRYFYARYADFGVGSEATQYKLNRLGTYSGTGGDGLTDKAKGGKFCTYDKDNTKYSGFADTQEGGWWYNTGFDSNLNGNFTGDNFGFYWSGTGVNLGYSRMMIRSAS